MIYKLIEWDGKGSGELSLITKSKSTAMAERECKLTYKAALKKYGKRHFTGLDVKCSEIISYTSRNAIRDGRSTSVQTWY